MIGGVQKGGTTALAQYLGRHPQLRLPACKEAHVFDAPDFDERWTADAIDARFEPLFPGGFDMDSGILHGDATPISIFHPAFVRRIARYNPAMRWIVLLRDPVERAISQYYMERSRGDEWLPLPLALLAERWRLKGHEHDFGHGSPLRHHSYLARGKYVCQLDSLMAMFPRKQVLLLLSRELRSDPASTVARVLAFLNIDRAMPVQPLTPVFAGAYADRLAPKLVRPGLRRYFLREVTTLAERYGVDFA